MCVCMHVYIYIRKSVSCPSGISSDMIKEKCLPLLSKTSNKSFKLHSSYPLPSHKTIIILSMTKDSVLFPRKVTNRGGDKDFLKASFLTFPSVSFLPFPHSRHMKGHLLH